MIVKNKNYQKEILAKLDNVLDIIGKDNFIFYDYNTINYIWKNH